MQTRILLGCAVALAAVLFVVVQCGGEDETAASPTPATETPATTEETTTEETTTTEENTTEEATTTESVEPAPGRINVRFQNGEVVGGVKEVEIDRNTQVVLTVRSDVADHVHVHGYDLFTDVAPGQPAKIRFRADLVGRFDIELEDRALPLVDLRVQP
jgi:hypothetical protein